MLTLIVGCSISGDTLLNRKVASGKHIQTYGVLKCILPPFFCCNNWRNSIARMFHLFLAILNPICINFLFICGSRPPPALLLFPCFTDWLDPYAWETMPSTSRVTRTTIISQQTCKAIYDQRLSSLAWAAQRHFCKMCGS